MGRSAKVAVGVGGCLATVIAALTISPNVDDVAHQAIQLHLRLIGSSIYEYYAQQGHWPSQNQDLAMTSLPRQSPYWDQLLQGESMVVVWHKDLKPNSKDNAGLVLTYHNKGTLAQRGRVWVCWGDLQTEYIETEELQAKLQAMKQ